MATVRTAEVHLEGSLMEGQGEVTLISSGLPAASKSASLRRRHYAGSGPAWASSSGGPPGPP
jgi:hypothetical protein